MNGSRTLALAAMALVLVPGAAASAALTAGDVDVGDGPPASGTDRPDGPDDTVNGVDAVTFWQLWSGDADPDSEPDVDAENQDGLDPYEKVRAGAAVRDFSFATPPAAAHTWNEGDHGDFDGGDQDASVYPAGLEDSLTRGGADVGRTQEIAVEDAYVAVFSIDPSTVVHQDGGTERLVAPDGEVRVISDFRVVDPDSRTYDDVKYRFTGKTVDRTIEFSAGGDTTTADGDSATFSYEGLSGPSTITVEMEIEAEIYEETKDCEEHDDDGSCKDDGWEDDWDRADDPTRVVVTQTRTIPVVVHEPPSATVKRIDGEGSVGGLTVDPDGERWTTVRAGDVTVHSGWRFFTMGSGGWSTMKRATADGATPSPSDVRPVRVHAYTADYGRAVIPNVTDPEAGRIEVSNARTDERPGTADLPGTVDLGGMSPAAEYQSVQSVTLESGDVSDVDVSDGEVVGLVAGHTASADAEGTTERRAVQIEFLSQSKEDGNPVYEMQVVDETGAVVTDGELVVEGERHELTGAPVTVTVEDPGITTSIEYVPPAPSESDAVYGSYSIEAPVTSEAPSALQVFESLGVVFVWFVPLLLGGLAMDYVFGTTLFRDSMPSVHASFQAISDAIRDRGE